MKIRGLTVSHNGALARFKFSDCMHLCSIVSSVVVWANKQSKIGELALVKVTGGYMLGIRGTNIGPLSGDECCEIANHFLRAHNTFRVIEGGNVSR